MKSITAQTPYRQYANDGVELNFFVIENVDFRACLLYNLTLDNRFVLIPEDENGILSLSSNDDLSREDFFDTFEDFYNNTFADFQLLSKQEITDLATMWKSEVDPRLFSSIMMDITLRNSRSGDNEHCMDALAFCTSDFYEFESASTTQTADDLEPNPIYDGCIGSSYNPSWYYLRIGDPGPFIIHMEGHDPENPNTLRDIDFCLWGPYTEEQVNSGYACSHLTSNMIIDCNYSASYLENAYLGYPANQHQHSAGHGTVNYHVPQTGEYYLLMITNYSRQPCFISFNKPEGEAGGAGTTDCSILPPIVNNDGPYCVGETIHLTAMGIAGASYNWTRPNGFYNPIQHTNYQNPNIQNCTMDMAGPYICTITKNGQTASDTTWVVIYPKPVANFTATTACVGTATQFDASSSTTNPPGHSIANYEWDFGDGTPGSGVTPNHTYAQAGTYVVTLNVSDADGHCSDEITQNVTVVSPVANFTITPSTTVCVGEDFQFDASSSTTDPPGYNIVSYEWDFGDGTTGSGVTTSHQYNESGSYEVTLYIVTDPDGHCFGVKTQTVFVAEEGVPAVYYLMICEDELPYTWNGVTFNGPGVQTVTIQNQGCQSQATLHLYVIDFDVNIEVEPDDEICQGDTVMLHATVDTSVYYVTVGDILCTDGTIVKPYHYLASGKIAKGIVFYVNDSHLHGWAVSLTQSEPKKWSTQNTLRIGDYTHWRDAITDFNGYDNTEILRTGTNANTYPAAWAVDFDNGWYLPSAGQVNLLFGELMDVNTSLDLVGGTLIEDPTGTYGSVNNMGDVYFWSSTEWNANQAMTIRILDGLVRSVDKGTNVSKYYVRSVINF